MSSGSRVQHDVKRLVPSPKMFPHKEPIQCWCCFALSSGRRTVTVDSLGCISMRILRLLSNGDPRTVLRCSRDRHKMTWYLDVTAWVALKMWILEVSQNEVVLGYGSAYKTRRSALKFNVVHCQSSSPLALEAKLYDLVPRSAWTNAG